MGTRITLINSQNQHKQNQIKVPEISSMHYFSSYETALWIFHHVNKGSRIKGSTYKIESVSL